MFVHLQLDPNSLQAEMLEIANLIAAHSKGNVSEPHAMRAYGLALFAAGASVFMPDNAFYQLYSNSARFGCAAPEHFAKIEKMRATAADRQDRGCSFPKQACLFLSESHLYLFCDYDRLKDDLDSTITWAFCQVMSNRVQFNAPRFILHGTCRFCQRRTDQCSAGTYHCRECEPLLFKRCPACGSLDYCNCKPDSWE